MQTSSLCPCTTITAMPGSEPSSSLSKLCRTEPQTSFNVYGTTECMIHKLGNVEFSYRQVDFPTVSETEQTATNAFCLKLLVGFLFGATRDDLLARI